MTEAKWLKINERSSQRPDRPSHVTERLKIPGGHLYRTAYFEVGDSYSVTTAVAMVFVPKKGS